MGTDETAQKQLFICNDVDLVPFMGLDEVQDFYVGDSLDGKRINSDPLTIRMALKLPKNLRCKSRKRFVKLLMSRGYSRNESERESRLWKPYGLPYKYAILCYTLDSVKEMAKYLEVIS